MHIFHISPIAKSNTNQYINQQILYLVQLTLYLDTQANIPQHQTVYFQSSSLETDTLALEPLEEAVPTTHRRERWA